VNWVLPLNKEASKDDDNDLYNFAAELPCLTIYLYKSIQKLPETCGRLLKN
jgi:hypothetical protein